MIAPSGVQIHLDAFDQELVAVEVGGGLRVYRAGGEDIIDGYPEDEMCAGGRGQMLAPWPNRLAGGRYRFAGASFQAPLSEADKGNAIHGLVRWSPWAADPDATGSESIRLGHRLHPQPGWGWTVDLSVTYTVSSSGLEVRTSAINVDDRPCPFGLGWHPYIRTDVDRTRLTLPAGTVYQVDDRGIPTGRGGVAGGDLDYRRARLIGPTRLDHCFTDLAGDADGRVTVTVERPDGRQIRWWADRHFSHVMIFSGDTLSDPARRRQGLAIEPMTGAPDLLNSGDGLIVLDPGQTWSASWGLMP